MTTKPVVPRVVALQGRPGQLRRPSSWEQGLVPPHRLARTSRDGRGPGLTASRGGPQERSPCPCALLSSRTASSPEPPGGLPVTPLEPREILAGSPGTDPEVGRFLPQCPTWAPEHTVSWTSSTRPSSVLWRALLNDTAPQGSRGYRARKPTRLSSVGERRPGMHTSNRLASIARAGRRDVRGGQDADGRHETAPPGVEGPLACRPALQGQPPATASVGQPRPQGQLAWAVVVGNHGAQDLLVSHRETKPGATPG